MLEQIHVLLFLVFGIFMLHILFLLGYAQFTAKKWHRTEKAVLKRVGQLKSNIDARAKAEFEALRLQFVKPLLPPIGDPVLPGDFIFSHYLSEVQGKAIAEMVAIPVSVWLTVLFTFVVFFLIAGAPSIVAIGLFVGLVYALLGGERAYSIIVGSFFISSVSALVLLKLKQVYRLLVPPVVHADGGANGGSSVNNGQAARAVELEEEKLLMPMRLDPPYVHIDEKASCCARAGNKQESLFWFGRHGPQLLLRVLSAVMFLTSLFAAVFGVWFVTAAWTEVEVVAVRFVLYVLIVVALLLIAFFMVPVSIRLLVVTSKIELLKHHKTIKRTLLEMRMQKVVRAMRLLNALRLSLEGEEGEGEGGEGEKKHGKQKSDGEEGEAAGAVRVKRAPEDVLGKEKLEEARLLFQEHSRGDGVLDGEEVAPMLKCLGIHVSRELSETMFKRMDKNGNGVSFDEFCGYLASVATLSTKGPMTEEDIEHLHKILDRTGSGEVTIDDFSVCFQSLGIEMSVGELNAFVRELDEDDSGAISVEELVKFLKKYSEE